VQSLMPKDLEKIQIDLEKYDSIREKMLEVSRLATRLSDMAIIMMHRGDLKKAKETLDRAEGSLREIELFLKGNPELKNSGNVVVAYQEYTEAKLLFHVIQEGKMPSLKKLDVESNPYILGLLDFIGELRRMALNFLRKGRAVEAEKMLKLMENIYEDLISLNHTAIIPMFRRKADIARKIVEATRGDVVTELRRMSLEKAIRGLEKKVREK
jgi:translin